MGVVYHAFDPVIERQVALKTIRVDLAEADYGKVFMARFRNEAKAAGRLHHPNIVGVYEYGEDADVAFIAMEYVEGLGTLRLRRRPAGLRLSQRGGAGRAAARGAGVRARLRRRPSRHQAVEPPRDEARRAQGRRLRRRPRRHDAPDRDRHDHRDAVVHVARAVPRRGGRCALRPLQHRHRPLRAADRAAAVSRPVGVDRLHDLPRAAGAAVAAVAAIAAGWLRRTRRHRAGEGPGATLRERARFRLRAARGRPDVSGRGSRPGRDPRAAGPVRSGAGEGFRTEQPAAASDVVRRARTRARRHCADAGGRAPRDHHRRRRSREDAARAAGRRRTAVGIPRWRLAGGTCSAVRAETRGPGRRRDARRDRGAGRAPRRRAAAAREGPAPAADPRQLRASAARMRRSREAAAARRARAAHAGDEPRTPARRGRDGLSAALAVGPGCTRGAGTRHAPALRRRAALRRARDGGEADVRAQRAERRGGRHDLPAAGRDSARARTRRGARAHAVARRDRAAPERPLPLC